MKIEDMIESLIRQGVVSREEVDAKIAEYRGNSPITTLQDENATLVFQNAIQDMNIQTLQDENAELLLKIAMMEANV